MFYDALSSAGFAPDRPAFWLAVFLFIAAVFFAVQAARQSRRAAAIRRELEATRIALASAEAAGAAAGALREDLASERERRETTEREAAADKARLAERERALEETKARLETEFKAMTADLLKGAHASFLERAKETFELYKQTASAEGEARRKALDELLRPVSETLVKYEKGLAEMRKEQGEARGALASQIGELARQTHDVRAEASKLSTALRAGPKTRGRWGEEQLKNVVEIAGMAQHVDFVEQLSHSDGEKRKIPDMVVRLPGERVIAVDSKVSLGAYMDAIESDSEEARAAALARHADDLWSHVRTLASKDYASSLKDALDYTVMFIPGESYYAAALEARPQLHQEAFERKILIATPTILIAVLKSAALNWRQERMTQYAQEVAGMAKDLYESLVTMSKHMAQLGRSLEGAVKNYNAGVGSFEGRVLSRARRFAEYQLPGIDKELTEPARIEGAVRELRASDAPLISGPESENDAA